MYTNESDFCRAAYEHYSCLSLPIDVICQKYNLTCLMSASRTGLPSSADTMYHLCRDNIDQVYYLYESEGMLYGGNVRDIAPLEMTQQEAALWVLQHSPLERLIEVLNGIPSSSGDLVDFEVVEEDDSLPF